jgi:hypothetical protein
MKPYLLFYGNTYYPQGGFADFKGAFDTTTEALTAFEEASLRDKEEFRDIDWGQIIDARTCTQVWGSGESCYHNFKP